MPMVCRRRRKQQIMWLSVCWWIDTSVALSQPGASLPKSTKPIINRSSPSPSQPKSIQRVCIVGAGIAGLSLAHALANSPSLLEGGSGPPEDDLTVSIFDSRKTLDYTTGSGVQLNGGMACLGKINQNLQRAVIDSAIPVNYLLGRHKSWSRDGEADKLWDYSVDEIIRSDDIARQELIDDNDKVLWYAIMRGALQEALLEYLPDSVNVSFGKTVIGISGSEENSGFGAYCRFLDGSSEGPFDLIVGCDGIKSAVKEYVEREKISEDASKREGSAAALYSGIRINYAVQENFSVEKNQPQPLQQYFANGAYALTGIYGNGKGRPPCRCFFVTSLDDAYNGPFKRTVDEDAKPQELSGTGGHTAAENADWTQNVKKPKEETREKMLQQLEKCGISDPESTSIISNADRFFELGVYFHNPISLSGWSKEVPFSGGSYAVLCGDAAHAMPPFLGQGANQAIQDAYSLAERIYDFNRKVEAAQMSTLGGTESNKDLDELPSLRKVLGQYQNARFAPTASITVKAALIGYLETGGRNGFYSKFRDLFFRFLNFAGVPRKVLLDSSTPKY